ncbi:hypothetical protein DH2020_006037 [Rehmannia glutinosa]|uniref:Uncharacterized protein n=1 Tax=Rehmannia glutinosa TaxID=99300 RepID=A0ABR0XI65_REHGL
MTPHGWRWCRQENIPASSSRVSHNAWIGLDFIESNGWAATHNDKISPTGFNIIFPAMVNYAKELDLTLPLSPTLLDSLLQTRDSEIRKQNQEYVAEGLGSSCDWKRVILTHQRSNGSLFNSPATTAAALIHSHDDKCFEYLNSMLKACNNWVPTIYPVDLYTHLCMVDTLERLGVNQYFGFELNRILDEIYRCWQEKDEQIFTDITCRAMAFRLLRVKGYDVSSDELEDYMNRERFFNTISIQYSGITTVLELYRASQVRMYGESILEKIHAWTSGFLKQQLLNQSILDKRLQKQVEYDLKNFHGTLDRVGNRRSIEIYDAQHFQILKSAYRCPTIHNKDFIQFSVKDFRISQAQYQNELQEMERWYVECGLDRLKQGRKSLQTSYIVTAAIIVHLELCVARMSHAKVMVLICCLDDFFDLYGSREEAFCIMELVRKWNMQPETTYCSQEVEILFTALYNTVNDVAEKVYANQGYCVKHDLVRMWLELLTNFARTMDFRSDNNVPTLDEYLSFAWKSVGSELCVFTPIHFLGMQLSKQMFTCEEYTSLCKHASMVCRLLNDLNSFKREEEEMTLNSVIVQTFRGISEEEAILKVQQLVEYHRSKMVKMVYESKGSIIPRECKQLFWKICKIAHCFYPYEGGDEFSSPRDIVKDLNAVIYEPLKK